eukprot:3102967-Amphidinium_carterae.1
MDAVQFCSDTMDALLTSQPVEDLAYGQCLRAHKKDDTYCRIAIPSAYVNYLNSGTEMRKLLDLEKELSVCSLDI